ncbi:hypothetical protein DL769_005376 [Monosporascus sp. CRB-8-3]|nr:hypothetical protein DL769_005376 [Monosporascus sp. CRB-8-3]
MCGVAGVLLGDPKAATAAVDLYESLFYLQHRGQDAAGISVCHGGRVYQCKANGMAQAVFRHFADANALIKNLPGWSEAQPFYINSPYGVSMSVNGNLINSDYLRKFLDTEARRHVNSDSDSEVLDANGIRPLCLGSRPSQTVEGAKDYFLASESIALRQLGFTDIYDILPGEAVFLEKGGIAHFRQIVERRSYTPDAFEFVYFSRPDSIVDGISVHRSRQNMGAKLANKLRETLGEKGIREIDVGKNNSAAPSRRVQLTARLVIPVPETSNTAAATLASCLGVEFSSAFVKNRYGTLSLTHFAYGRTPQEIAQHINADAVIFQDLGDLTAACIEAAEGESEVQDFEVGVFSGKYITEVPEGYFEHLSNLRGNKGRLVNVTAGQQMALEKTSTAKNGLASPEYSEDINIHNLASTSH